MRAITTVAVVALSVLVATAPAQEAARGPAPVYKPTIPLDHPAIRELTPAGDAVSRLRERVARGEARLTRGGDGYLTSVLAALDVAVDSQLLVFSKTSVQAARISPSRPRAIYFSDDVMVAHVPGTPGIELIAIDAARGPVFYVLGDRPDGPTVTASTTCLTCHHGPNTAGVPGIYVGSVIPGPSGAPLRDDTAIITDHTTPFWERWGGWYVTAARGEPRTRANAIASSPNDPGALVRDVPSNARTLHAFFDPRPYPAPTSDIVALLVFEHQTQMTNLLTRVAWQARVAGATLAADVRDLVDYMLCADETPLNAPVAGVSTFAATFQARGPRDARGRSLRDLDLETRLLRYPLSYAVYSQQFQTLPVNVRRDVLGAVKAILTSPPAERRYAHLTTEVRQATLAVARATVPDLPPGW